MAKDHRIRDTSGQAVSYSCENRRYRTDIAKGEPHSPLSQSRGSVFPSPLVQCDGYSLWLEHVQGPETEAEVYWLMWYDPDGVPTIPSSGIFGRTELSRMLEQLARFVP